MAPRDFLVVVTFDAGAGSITVNPNPIQLTVGPEGCRLFMALQTVNCGAGEVATLASVSITNESIPFRKVGGCEQLFAARFTPEHSALPPLQYSVTCDFSGDQIPHRLDPTIILQPATGGPPGQDRPARRRTRGG